MTAVDQVYRVHSTVEVSYDDLEGYLENPDLPSEIDHLTSTERGNQVFIESVPADDSIGKYTPTATLRATVTEARVYEYDGVRSRTEPSTPDDEPPPSTVETFANFKGRAGTVIKNTALRAPMFEVLEDIAFLADRGGLTAIVDRDNSLTAIAVEDGNEVPASVDIVDGADQPAHAGSPHWENTRT